MKNEIPPVVGTVSLIVINVEENKKEKENKND